MNGDAQAAADVLDGLVPLGPEAVPDEFAYFVAERIATRPSPQPAQVVEQPDQISRIESKLDEILAILRGGAP